MNKLQKCARISAALLATAVFVEAAETVAYADRVVVERTTGAVILALQLQFPFDVGFLSGGLVGASPG
jgi:hypothetical protein